MFAVPAIALTIFIYAYSTRFGQVAILAYYALWLPLIVLNPQHFFDRMRGLLLPGAFVTLILSSTLWSNAPLVTLRGSVQFTTHALCVLIISKVTNLRTLTRGILAGMALVIPYSITFGYYAYDVLDGSYTFVGAFASKNQLGFYCSVGMLFAIFSLSTQRESWAVRVGIALLFVACAIVLSASHSATSTIALGVASIAFSGLVAVLRFGSMLRGFVLLLLLPAAAFLAFAAQQMGTIAAVLEFFGKDPTLTGRTYLWGEAMRSFWKTPIAGVGYMGYWVQGMSDAERLWHEFYITARTGFHFHNTFVETLVETGVIGTALMVLFFVLPLVWLVKRIVWRRDMIAACQLALLILLLVRSASEVDVLYSYTLGSFLFIQLYLASTSSSDVRFLLPKTISFRKLYHHNSSVPSSRSN